MVIGLTVYAQVGLPEALPVIYDPRGERRIDTIFLEMLGVVNQEPFFKFQPEISTTCYLYDSQMSCFLN